ncbi:hypothetical protein BKA62DRAFT_825685 [Auriculariales sp. MPI-PUGE-AT-0066]|nr:hypothetical protein BKA62DRAFT_825685 [Auriculariales sp. MPI-PUGE-AT-0066]
MFSRRGLQHVCFMCAHAGRAITTHTLAVRSAIATSTTASQMNTAPPASTIAASGEQSALSPDLPTPPKATKRARKVKSPPMVQDPDIVPEPRQPGRSEAFVELLKASVQEPTLHEVERLRPEEQPDLNSAEYTVAFNEVVDSICKRFSKNQIRKMTEEVAQGALKRIPSTKIAWAQLIVTLKWGWRDPKEIASEQAERMKVHATIYKVAPNELFLLLGRDGTNLLRLSLDLQVRISVEPGPDSLSLRVEGLRQAVNNMENAIHEIRQNMITETIDYPVPDGLHKDLIQRISKMSNAFLENMPNGKLRITARRDHELSSAKRLVIRAAAIDNRESSIPLLMHRNQNHDRLSMLPRKYALYPFLAQRTMLWTMGTGGSFRARKVSEWMGVDDDFTHEGGLATGQVITFSGQDIDLRKSLLDKMAILPEGHERMISAYPGNILFTSRTSGAQRATLSSPLEDPVAFPNLLKWINSTSLQYKSTFVPELPAALLNAIPSESIPLNRLVYRAAQSPEAAESGIHAPGYTKTIAFDLVIPEMTVKASQDRIIPEMEIDRIECRVGEETTVDILMPDRPMDIRFNVFDYVPKKIDEAPNELSEYASTLKEYFANPEVTQPNPPLHVTYDGTTYTLDTSSSVRRSVEEFMPPAGHEWGIPEPTQAITESTIDFEGSQRATNCQIVCADTKTERGWITFLKHCDRLTMKLPRKINHMVDDFDIMDLDSVTPTSH